MKSIVVRSKLLTLETRIRHEQVTRTEGDLKVDRHCVDCC